jgi:AraC-like DNA-binding protein
MKRGRIIERARQLPKPENHYDVFGVPECSVPDDVLVFHIRTLGHLTPNMHGRHMLIFNMGGNATIHLDNRAYAFQPGECRLVLPFQLHQYSDVGGLLDWLYITFRSSAGLDALRNQAVSTSEEMESEIHLLLNDYHVDPAVRKMKLVALRLAMLLELVMEGVGERSELTMFEPSWASRVIDLTMRELANSKATLCVAREIGMSESGFRTKFRKTFGRSVGQYQQQLRMSRARVLLANSRKSVKEIAVECGYQSQTTFSNTFKRLDGLSPREYRREHN